MPSRRPFAGNPAGDCLIEEPLPRLDHAVPRHRVGDRRDRVRHPGRDGRRGGGTTRDTFGLRWFSPRVEIDLCGHATLAAAHALRAHTA